MEGYRDKLFKGCTRPAMLASVPMMPFFLVTGVFVVVGMYGFNLISPWFFLLVVMLYVPVYSTMRLVTKKDDQRLSQLFLRMRMRVRLKAARVQWGAVTYSPLKYREKKL